MPSETSLASAALAIALVALVIAVGQLLQQVFATAEGYRRCQPSVLGPWAKRTRLRWRWSQFRFEVLFVTPRIKFMTTPRGALMLMHTHPEKFFKPETLESTSDIKEMASWIPLLVSLYRSTSAVTEQLTSEYPDSHHEMGLMINLPFIDYVERSWDFMPPDVSRPMALTTVQSIGIIAVRLGMTWKDVRPTEGVMIAEGSGFTLTSSIVRGVGLVMGLTSEDRHDECLLFGSVEPPGNRLAPTRYADRLAFGVVTADFRLRRLPFGSSDETFGTLREIDPSGTLVERMSNFQQREGDRMPGVSDFICMVCVPVRLLHSTIMRIPRPSNDVLGPINSVCGTIAFQICLDRYVSSKGTCATEQSKHILQSVSGLERVWPQWTKSRSRDSLDEPSMQYLDAIHRVLDTMRSWLEKFRNESEANDDLYHAVLIEHISLAVVLAREARENAKRVALMYTSEMRGYFKDDFAGLYASFTDLPDVSKNTVVDLWLTLAFRGICWARLHWMALDSPFSTIPARYCDSQLPVYIG